jgi:hypothetical protein
MRCGHTLRRRGWMCSHVVVSSITLNRISMWRRGNGIQWSNSRRKRRPLYSLSRRCLEVDNKCRSANLWSELAALAPTRRMSTSIHPSIHYTAEAIIATFDIQHNKERERVYKTCSVFTIWIAPLQSTHLPQSISICSFKVTIALATRSLKPEKPLATPTFSPPSYNIFILPKPHGEFTV